MRSGSRGKRGGERGKRGKVVNSFWNVLAGWRDKMCIFNEKSNREGKRKRKKRKRRWRVNYVVICSQEEIDGSDLMVDILSLYWIDHHIFIDEKMRKNTQEREIYRFIVINTTKKTQTSILHYNLYSQSLLIYHPQHLSQRNPSTSSSPSNTSHIARKG